MQGIMEGIFDACYLSFAIIAGIYMIKNSREKQHKLFGIMAVTLGCGDAFHLVPRVYALLGTGLNDHVAALGFGKFVTSITMTIFYVILYYVWRKRYNVKDGKNITLMVYILAALRIILCLMPQNMWFSSEAPLSWGIYRNIPFALLGLVVIVLFYKSSRKYEDTAFKNMYLTIILSFGFYIPVVLFADTIPVIGMLMIPKTLAYVWTIWIGFSDMRRSVR